ncbi:MAG: hypothetical protein AYL29_000550 [Candidatus Bathyarchaeota archaeon B24]|nr:MAG: hypothetical protein AYL29_000550 [Candidatus Bathyarchaeota archaeon B24]
MYLTRHEERILKGEEGYARQKAMEILVALGEIYEADRLIPVSSAQIAGVSYTSLGDDGIEWLESLEGAHVTIPAVLNPAGMDLENWRRMGVDPEYARKQIRIIEAYKRLGVRPLCSCTPYLLGMVPMLGEHVAWSESSAVCYANSVLGARTNREGGPSALASAIIGKTPNYGYHLDENRKAGLIIEVEVELKTISDYSALGYWAGKLAESNVPYFKGLKGVDSVRLKALGAGLGAGGSVALYHVEGVTPEHKTALVERVERHQFGEVELGEVYTNYFKPIPDRVDLAAIGCPHASLDEVKEVAELVKGRRIKDDSRLWVFTSIAVKRMAERCGYLDIIRAAGGEVYADGCMALAPLKDMGIERVAVNSSKAAFYTRLLAKVDAYFGDLRQCIESVIGR